jgi:peroxiredoxin
VAVPLLIAAVTLLGLLVVGQWIVLYQVLRQQGRLLLRLDEVEQGLSPIGQAAFVPTAAANGHVQPRGLPVGTSVPPFRLPDLTGKRVGLNDFRGKRVLVVHWSLQCGFCIRIAPELARLQLDLHKHNVELLLLSYGDAAGNRRLAEEYDLTYPILLQEEGESWEAFQRMGTPVAYLLDGQGRVAKPVAIGAEEVLALAHEAARSQKRLPGERPLSESRIEREGLKPGTPAPTFSLPDVHGRTVSFQEYRGRRVLLVFSDPQCGPCNSLAPDLFTLYKEHHDARPALVVISRGSMEENHRMAEEYGFKFPVLIQPNWKVSKDYGISSRRSPS